MPRHWNKLNYQSNLKDYIHFQNWTPESLRNTRKKLKITQQEVADVMGVSKVIISHAENGHSVNPMTITLYGIILERYWAGIHGYIPAYRKIGENKFMEEQNGLYEIQRRDVQAETGGRRSKSCTL